MYILEKYKLTIYIIIFYLLILPKQCIRIIIYPSLIKNFNRVFFKIHIEIYIYICV